MKLVPVLFLLVLSIQSGAKSACKSPPDSNRIALAYLDLRADLALTAGRCMGFTREFSAEHFSRFLDRHKNLTLSAEKDAGELLKKTLQTNSSARSVGDQYYNNTLLNKERLITQNQLKSYCESSLERFKQAVTFNPAELKKWLGDRVCQNTSTSP